MTSGPPGKTPPEACHEPARETPVVRQADVVVCGGGPAGIAAAIGAARAGAGTLLLEGQGCLGGIWTSGLLGWILDHENKTGVMREIMDALQRHGGRGPVRNAYDPEAMKIVLEELCASAGVEIQLHTRVCAALRNDENRLTHAIIESKSGREAVAGKVFVDCTGDGDLGAAAGCGFDYGNPETGLAQPMTLLALVAGVVPAEIAAFYPEPDSENWDGFKDRLRAEMEKAGQSPSYAKPTLFRLCGDLFVLMANHEYRVSGLDANDMTQATLRARRELHGIVDGLRALGRPWKNLRIVATGAQIGVREGRRLHGRYTVSADDLREGRRHEDAVCRVTYEIDVHATDPKRDKGIETNAFTARPYDIPLRALIARDVDGLLMAGRCISGDFIAHSSYRVTGNAVVMGEAAGATAALAARGGRLPQDVPWTDISEILKSTASPVYEPVCSN
ncbi:MAG: FAD-dependent oxidoreductase [Terrimicrobiaceae bacterium]